MKKALIAMSGGVDSSVAAWLTKAAGFDCVGATMKLFANQGAVGGCCSLHDAQDARHVAHRLNMPFYTFNFTKCFEEMVIRRFVGAYMRGVTPNPCIDCNRYMKFERFLERAVLMDCACMVTGHYAGIVKDSGSKRFLLTKGIDHTKDQSYVLYSMTQEQLSRTRLPLGALQKSQVREIARQQGFLNAQKKESQDICFVPDRDYAAFIETFTGEKQTPGRFLDMNGEDMGEHRGILHYTIGQRRGIGVQADYPLYVQAIGPERNTVTLGTTDTLYTNTLTARDINLIALDRIDASIRVHAKIRYRHTEQPATVWQLDADTLRVEFDSPQRAITKGQAVVLYDVNTVVGGGTIS